MGMIQNKVTVSQPVSHVIVQDAGGLRGLTGPQGIPGVDGKDGVDGFSPIATVNKAGDTATITITDKDGTTTASISDGTTPTVNDGTLTIQKNGTTVQTFSADQASNVTANITVPTQFSELSGTVSSSQIEDEAITTGSVSGTGTNITLAGTMEGGAIESVELDGDTEQTTYSGKNLFQHGSSFSINDTQRYRAVSISGIKNNTSYEVQFDSVTTNSARDSFLLAFSAGTTQKYYAHPTKSGKFDTFTTGSDGTTIDTVYIYSSDGYASSYGVATTYQNLMIAEGNTKTDYEPYVGGTASPNPDYPQNVNVVTGLQSIEVRGSKNLFNKTTITAGYYIDNSGNLVADGSNFVGDYIKIYPENSYVVSATTTNAKCICYYDNAKTFISRQLGSSSSVVLDIPSNARYVRLSCYNTDLDTLQLELGSTATTYEPYKGVTKTVNLGKNLFNKDSFPSVDGFIRADNYTLTSSASNKTTYIKVGPNTTYTFSGFALGVALVVGTFNKVPALGDVANARVLKGASDTTVTITTGASDSYIAFMYQTSSDTLDTSAFQIEKGSVATTYAPYFTPIELCKIGTYQDYIYKSGDDWYLHKATNKYIIPDTDVAQGADYANVYFAAFPKQSDDLAYGAYPNTQGQVYSAATFQAYSSSWNRDIYIGKYVSSATSNKYWVGFPAGTTLATAQVKLNGSILYYALATPTDTQITNATLISELEDLLSATTYSGNTYITVSGDLASPLEVVAEADSKLAPDSVYGAAIKDGAVSVDKIADLKALADALAPYLNS